MKASAQARVTLTSLERIEMKLNWLIYRSGMPLPPGMEPETTEEVVTEEPSPEPQVLSTMDPVVPTTPALTQKEMDATLPGASKTGDPADETKTPAQTRAEAKRQAKADAQAEADANADA